MDKQEYDFQIQRCKNFDENKRAQEILSHMIVRIEQDCGPILIGKHSSNELPNFFHERFDSAVVKTLKELLDSAVNVATTI